MKKIILISISCLISIVVNSQNGKKFDYEPSQFGSYLVSPVFDQTKGEGKLGQAFWSDNSYVTDLIYSIIKDVLSEEKLDSLHLGSGYIITFNSKGEILNCKFSIKYEDKNVISENDLYNLYIRFKKIKIDMSKVKIVSFFNHAEDKVLDYAEIFGSIIPLGNRDKFKKSK